jgi:hypothetical protein
VLDLVHVGGRALEGATRDLGQEHPPAARWKRKRNHGRRSGRTDVEFVALEREADLDLGQPISQSCP